MKTPAEWQNEGLGWIHQDLLEVVQKDAYIAGLTKAICVVSSRLIPEKNASYTRAINESVIFLKAEIEKV